MGDGLGKEEDRMSGKEGKRQYVGEGREGTMSWDYKEGGRGRKEVGCQGGKEPRCVYCAFPVDSDESLGAGTHESRSAGGKGAALPFMWNIQF